MNLNNDSKKQEKEHSICPKMKLANDVIDEICNLERKMPFLEYSKSDYMLDADILMGALFDYKNNQTLESKKEVERISNNLINSKEELIRELIEYMNCMNALDHAIRIWRHQNE